MTEGGEFAMWLAIGAGQVAFWVAMYPLFTSLAERIRGRAAAPADLEARIEALESRSPLTGETDLVHQRVVELEERLDFAERMLARQGEAARLPEAPLPRAHEEQEITPIGGAQ
ncbi:MAG: hypothetical protein ACREMH_10215 [Gemmatimonadales bacterium]